MAVNDPKRIPAIRPDPEGKLTIPPINEAFREAFTAIRTLEGRNGEVTIRDDVRVDGAHSLEGRVDADGNNNPPEVSDSTNATIYFDSSLGKLQASEAGRAYVDLVPSTSLLKRIDSNTIGPALTGDRYRGPIQDVGSTGGQVFSVRAYGAVGNGVTDDTAAINNAITAVNGAGGGVLFFPAGTYLVSSAIPIGASVSLMGAGANCTIIRTNSATADVFSFSYSISGTGFNPIIVRDLRIDAEGVTRTAGAYLRFDASSAGANSNLRVLVESCYFRGCFYGVYFNDHQDSGVFHCLFTGVASGGVPIYFTTTAPFSADGGDNMVNGCALIDEGSVASVGVQAADGGAGIRITNTKILGFSTAVQLSTTAGRTSNDTHVSDCSIESFRGVGIDIVPSGTYNHILIQDNDMATATASTVGIRYALGAAAAHSTSIISGNRITMGSAGSTRCLQLNSTAGCSLAQVYVYGNIFDGVAVAVETNANVTGTCKAWGNFMGSGVTTAWSIGSTNFGLDFLGGYGIKADYGGLGTSVGGAWLSTHGGSLAGIIELISSASDAAGKIPGILDFVYDTNSASHKRVAGMDAVTEGTTANQRGGSLNLYTKPDGSTSIATRLYISNKGSVVVGTSGALATNATDGFLYIPTSAGAPTGTPTTQTGTVALQYDTTNNNLYVYNGAWKKVLLA